MMQSTTLQKLAAALAKAQSQIKPAVKDSLNPHFKSKYADLAAVWEACRPALTANELAVAQYPGPFAHGELCLTTILIHSSGEYLGLEMTIPVSKADPQGYGSALSYARRYALAAVVGIYQDDDDANTATRQPQPPAAQPVTVPDGYEAWAVSFAQAASGGLEKLREAFSKAKPEYRSYLTQHDVERYNKARTQAADAGKVGAPA